MVQSEPKSLIIEGRHGDIDTSSIVQDIIGAIFGCGWSMSNFSLIFTNKRNNWEISLEISQIRYEGLSDLKVAPKDFERLQTTISKLPSVIDIRET